MFTGTSFKLPAIYFITRQFGKITRQDTTFMKIVAFKSSKQSVPFLFSSKTFLVHFFPAAIK